MAEHGEQVGEVGRGRAEPTQRRVDEVCADFGVALQPVDEPFPVAARLAGLGQRESQQHRVAVGTGGEPLGQVRRQVRIEPGGERDRLVPRQPTEPQRRGAGQREPFAAGEQDLKAAVRTEMRDRAERLGGVAQQVRVVHAQQDGRGGHGRHE